MNLAVFFPGFVFWVMAVPLIYRYFTDFFGSPRSTGRIQLYFDVFLVVEVSGMVELGSSPPELDPSRTLCSS